jgi:hypothetical protein
MYRSRKKQEAQHKIHQQFPKVDGSCYFFSFNTQPWIKFSQYNQQHGATEGKHHYAYGRRPFDEPVIDVGERSS